MSQTSCDRCGFPVPMRWLHAGGDLSRPNRIHQCRRSPVDALRTAAEMPTALSRPRCPCRHRRWRRAGVPLIIEIGANIKSP